MFLKRFKRTDFYKKHKYRLKGANDLLSMVSALLLILFVYGDQSLQVTASRYMVGDIETTALLTGLHTGLYKIDRRVIKAMTRIPRDQFVGRKYVDYAYLNIALPMQGHDHMLPEPFLSAMMIHLMDIDPEERVLEIGYGMGYETAIMAQLAAEVYSIRQKTFNMVKEDEFEPLEFSGYENVITRTGNGVFGWKEAGPFDAILIKQSLPFPPLALIGQLKYGGRLVMPIIENGEPQQRLTVFTKEYNGSLSRHDTLYIKITPLLTGKEA